MLELCQSDTSIPTARCAIAPSGPASMARTRTSIAIRTKLNRLSDPARASLAPEGGDSWAGPNAVGEGCADCRRGWEGVRTGFINREVILTLRVSQATTVTVSRL